MTLAYFDCFSGISGDMVLGALVDAGCDLARLEAELRRLPLSGWTISAEKVRRGALSATQVRVGTAEPHAHEHSDAHRLDHGHTPPAHEHQHHEHHPHRSLGTILGLIEQARLAPRVAERARRIFQRLGAAEAKVHNVPVEFVHFHEVGAVDAIVDIVGACAGFELLGVDEFACSALNVGGGQVQTQHGMLPVPAPATAELLRGAPMYSTGVQRELVTPTGAAIAATLAKQFGPMPPMTTGTIGYGAGTAELSEQANLLRLFVGTRAAAQPGTERYDRVAIIEANLDDMNPQIYGYFAERALEAGALEVFATPVHMKKNRPGHLLTVLCAPAAVERMKELIFRETTTIGVRVYEALRHTLERESVAVETSAGAVRVKIASSNGSILNVAPEYEDCRRVAAECGVPLKQVLTEAVSQFQKQRKLSE